LEERSSISKNNTSKKTKYMLGSSNKDNSVLIVLKPVSKLKTGEVVKPFFQISKKVGAKWEIDEDQSISEVTGDLSKVEAVEEEYQGDKYFRIKLYLRDGGETYLIPFRLNIATRGLLNALFSLETFKDVTISYYQSKAGYDVYSVSQDGKRVSWKFELSELPVPDEVTLRGKKIRDYTNLDNFYLEQVEELSQKVGKKNSSTNKQEVEETEVDENVEF